MNDSAPGIQMTIEEPRPDSLLPPSMPAAPSTSADYGPKRRSPSSLWCMDALKDAIEHKPEATNSHAD